MSCVLQHGERKKGGQGRKAAQSGSATKAEATGKGGEPWKEVIRLLRPQDSSKLD